MHSGYGLTPESSMRTHALALNAQTAQKLAVTHVDAGAMYCDEYFQLQGEASSTTLEFCEPPTLAKRNTA